MWFGEALFVSNNTAHDLVSADDLPQVAGDVTLLGSAGAESTPVPRGWTPVDVFVRNEALHKEAVARGLTCDLSHACTAPHVFFFDLNSGHLYMPDPTPERVMALVALARRYAASASDGVHRALLLLETRRASLTASQVTWDRWHHTAAGTSGNPWVPLGVWLHEHDQHPETI